MRRRTGTRRRSTASAPTSRAIARRWHRLRVAADKHLVERLRHFRRPQRRPKLHERHQRAHRARAAARRMAGRVRRSDITFPGQQRFNNETTQIGRGIATYRPDSELGPCRERRIRGQQVLLYPRKRRDLRRRRRMAPERSHEPQRARGASVLRNELQRLVRPSHPADRLVDQGVARHHELSAAARGPACRGGRDGDARRPVRIARAGSGAASGARRPGHPGPRPAAIPQHPGRAVRTADHARRIGDRDVRHSRRAATASS